jgi:hypothetical protein
MWDKATEQTLSPKKNKQVCTSETAKNTVPVLYNLISKKSS